MSLVRKVRAVEREFRHLDKEIATFQEASGLRCLSGCGKCCFNAKIEATPLEFLPYALALFREGQAEQVWEDLKTNSRPSCAMLRPMLASTDAGFCTQYEYRGMVCRLFGYSAMRNKHGERALYTCKLVKENQPQTFAEAEQAIKGTLNVPVVSDWYRRLSAIDSNLGGKLFPINQAITVALEEVMHYYAYRKPPRPMGSTAPRKPRKAS